MIFVFGSNLAGRHGKGAALYALKNYGAKYGQGEGLQGSSYAIPTKDRYLKSLQLDEINEHISEFVVFTTMNLDKIFLLTPIGCGLAGYNKNQIWPMFETAGIKSCKNIVLHQEWLRLP